MNTNASSMRVPPPFLGPDDVPESVSEATAWSMLHALKPIAEEGELRVAGIRSPFYERAGFEQPGPHTETRGLLLIHGLGHDASDFAAFFHAHASRRSLIAIDLPGFGLADKPRQAYPLSLLSDAVLAAAKRFVAPPIVVASSLGGHVAMLAALKEPNAFAGLILLAPGGLSHTPMPLQSFARSYYSYDAIVRRTDHEILKNARRIYAENNHHVELQIARKIALHRSPLKNLFAWPFSSVVDDVFRHPVGEKIREIKVPVHIVSGDRDLIVPAVECRIAAQRADVPFHVLSGVGHLPMVEVPEQFAGLTEQIAQKICAMKEIL